MGPLANAAPIKFKQDKFELTAHANKKFSLDLTALLELKGENRLWSTDNNKPKWLSINGDLAEGTPEVADIGSTVFVLRVQSGENGASAQITMVVTGAPQWTSSPLDLGTQKEDSPFSMDLNDHIENPTGAALTFKAENLPEWLNLEETGILSGTPLRPHVGGYSEIRLTVDSSAGSSTTEAFGVVEINLKPPSWSTTSIDLGQQKEGVLFSFDLKTLVENPSGESLAYTGNKLPEWMSLSPNGVLSGTPTRDDVGDYQDVELTVSGQDGSDVAQAFGTVLISLNPPKWKQPRVDFGIQKEGFPFELDLKTWIQEPVEEGLVFSAENLPDWLTLEDDGSLYGTPQRKDVGDYSGISITVEGEDGSDTAEGYGTVLKTEKAPSWVSKSFTLPDAYEDALYSQELNQPKFITNLDNIGIEFNLKTSNAPWLTLTKEGKLSGTPGKNDIKPVNLVIEFKGKLGEVAFKESASFNFNVIHVNHAPKWIAKEIRLPDAFTEIAYQQLLHTSVSDPDEGDTLSFELLSPKKWIEVNKSGGLSGTPQTPDVGQHRWQVRVTDEGGLSDEATIIIQVIQSNKPPYWINKPTILPKAKEDSPYSVRLSDYARDPDEDPLSFTLLEGPAWATINANGFLIGTPRRPDVGLQKFKIRVSDGIASHTDIAELMVEVEETNHAPEWILEPVFQVKEDALMNENLARFAKDSDGDTLSFQILTHPTNVWATLNTEGTQFTGTPRKINVGDNVFTVRAMDDKGLFTDARVVVQVLPVNHAPEWTQNPIDLPDAKERVAYSASVASFAKDIDPGDILSFAKVPNSGAEWVTVRKNGIVEGTPQRAHLGLNSFQVRVMDQDNELSVATVRIRVQKVNTPPRWRMSPLILSDAVQDTDYNFDLRMYAVDDDGDPITFRKKEGVGPDWMFVSSTGQITGVPLKQHIGDFSTFFVISDGQAEAEVEAKGRVLPKNHAPIIKPNIVFVVKERQSFSVSLNQPQYVEDIDGDPLQFQLIEQPGWVTLSPTGDLVINPKHEHVGDHRFCIRVSDGELATDGKFQVKVLRDPLPPKWLEDPIRLTARTNEAFSTCVNHLAVELEGEPLTFSCKENPGFVSCDQKGCLSGTPKDADEGLHRFLMEARNDGKGTDVVIELTVVPGTIIQTIQVDEPVPGAKAENLWVVDSSRYSYKLKTQLKGCIHHYYDALEEAKIHHTGIYLSADAHKWDGKPIRTNNTLMRWDNPKWVKDFVNRTDIAYSNNCFNTPLWSMFRFHQRLPGLPEYKQNYFLANVPMDALIVTNQLDHYPRFTKGTPQANYNAEDFAEDFMDIHKSAEKSYRVSAIAPECPSLSENSGEPWTGASKSAYRTLVNKTQGTYYSAKCTYDMPNILRDYAKKVIFRAYVHAKSSIRLNKTPISPNSITVRLGGKPLPGNSGSSDDKWSYDASSNSVKIFWQRIDLSTLSPGEQIEIEYRVN